MENLLAKELRIGNYFFTDNRMVIKSYSPEGLFNILKDVELNKIKPIPLTEEWLLKFGFDKHITLDIYPTYVKGIFNVNDNLVYISGLGFINHIKHVHQLQNLYFALTGEELTLSK